MANSALRYTLEVDNSSAKKGTDEIIARNEEVGKSAQRGTAAASAGYGSMTAQATGASLALREYRSQQQSATADIVRNARTAGDSLRSTYEAFSGYASRIDKFFGSISTGTIALTAGALVFKGFGAEVRTFSGEYQKFGEFYTQFAKNLPNIAKNVGIEELVALRGTLAVIGGGAAIAGIALATVKTAQLVQETGKLLELRASYAAKSGVDFQTVGTLDTTASFQASSGRPTSDYQSAYQALQAAKGSGSYGTALHDLGLGNENTKVTPELLGKIGKAFDDITDPAQRATTAYRLFGDQFEQVLPNLNSRLQESITKSQQFGQTLTEYQSENVYRAKQRIDGLVESFTNLFHVSDGGYFKKLKNEFVDFAATVVNALPQYTLDKDKLTADANRLGTVVANRALGDSSRRGALQLASRNDVSGQLYEDYRKTKDSLDDELGDAKSRRKEAFEKLFGDQTKPLDPATIATYTQQATAASQTINYLTPKIEAIDQAKKDEEEAKSHATAIRREVAERQRGIRDELATAQAELLSPLPRAFTEFQKQSVDKVNRRIGDKIEVLPLTPEELTQRQSTLASVLFRQQKEDIQKQTEQQNQDSQLRQDYEIRRLKTRTDAEDAFNASQIAAGDRIKAAELDNLAVHHGEDRARNQETGY